VIGLATLAPCVLGGQAAALTWLQPRGAMTEQKDEILTR